MESIIKLVPVVRSLAFWSCLAVLLSLVWAGEGLAALGVVRMVALNVAAS